MRNLLLLVGAWLMLSGTVAAQDDADAATSSTAAAASGETDQPTRAERRAARREANRQARFADETSRTASNPDSADQTAENAEAGEVAAQPEPDDDLICRREAVSGSHFRVRRCYTRAEREEARRGAQELMRETRASGAAGETGHAQ